MGGLYAQHNPQLTQYMLNGLPLNPAFAGSRKALSFTSSHRTQWVGFGDALYTSTVSVHTPNKNENLGIGFFMFRDVIGVSEKTGIIGNLAYQINFRGHRELSFGLSGGFVWNKNKWTDLVTNDNTDYVFDSNEGGITPNIGTGVYYRTRSFYASLSSPFMVTPKARDGRIISNISPKGFNVFLVSGYRYKLNPKIDIVPSFMTKYLYASAIQYDINVMTKYKIRRHNQAIEVGFSWRNKESLIGIVKFEMNKPIHMVIGYAYDYTLNAIRLYSKGSHEISLQFDLVSRSNSFNPRYF